MIESNQVTYDPGQTVLIEHFSSVQNAIEDYEPIWKSVIYEPLHISKESLPMVPKPNMKKLSKTVVKTFFIQNKSVKEITLKASSIKSKGNKKNPKLSKIFQKNC